jgi:hypothetical protein
MAEPEITLLIQGLNNKFWDQTIVLRDKMVDLTQRTNDINFKAMKEYNEILLDIYRSKLAEFQGSWDSKIKWQNL